MNELSEKRIYVTSNYDLFKKLKGNRAVERPRIDKIKASIEEVGYITNPIIVNEKYEKIDGQGRFEALKELGLPIEYVIHEGAGIDECISMNIFQEKWKLTDYINSYADRKVKDYVFLRDIINTYGAFSVPTIINICCGNMDYSPVAKIKNGTYKVTRTDSEIINILDYLSQFEPYARYFPAKDIAYKVLAWIWDSEEIDSEQMLEKVSKYYSKIKPYTCTEEALKSLQDIYNFKSRGSTIHFIPLYDAYAESRNAATLSHRRNKEC